MQSRRSSLSHFASLILHAHLTGPPGEMEASVLWYHIVPRWNNSKRGNPEVHWRQFHVDFLRLLSLSLIYIYIHTQIQYLLHRLTVSSKLNVESHANFVSWNRLHPRWQPTAHNRAECHQLQPRRWPWTWRQDETVKKKRGKTWNGILFSFCWRFCLYIYIYILRHTSTTHMVFGASCFGSKILQVLKSLFLGMNYEE